MTAPSRRFVTSDTRIGRFVVLVIIVWIVFKLIFRLYSTDKWQTVYIPKCNCQIDYPLYWGDSSNNATRGSGLSDAISLHTDAFLLMGNKNNARVFFNPDPNPGKIGLEDWMDKLLINRRAQHVKDFGEQILGKENIMARYKTYQLSYDHRIYYFFTNDGYYAIDFYSQNFNKNEEMFAQILASFEILK